MFFYYWIKFWARPRPPSPSWNSPFEMMCSQAPNCHYCLIFFDSWTKYCAGFPLSPKRSSLEIILIPKSVLVFRNVVPRKPLITYILVETFRVQLSNHYSVPYKYQFRAPRATANLFGCRTEFARVNTGLAVFMLGSAVPYVLAIVALIFELTINDRSILCCDRSIRSSSVSTPELPPISCGLQLFYFVSKESGWTTHDAFQIFGADVLINELWATLSFI